MGKAVKLIMITSANNNKFYNMTENSDGTFTTERGRVGANPVSDTYSMSKWDSKYNEKIKKGYKDNTELFIVEDAETTDTVSVAKKTMKDFISARSKEVISIVKKLQSWAKGSIAENYTVSAEKVTQKQVDKAQEVLNEIIAFDLNVGTIDEFNEKLLEFYGIVPRKMKHVKDHLIATDVTDLLVKKNTLISDEQDTLDVMSGQVKLNTPNLDADADGVEDEETDLIKSSGLDIKEVSDKTIIDKIKKLMGPNANQFKSAFEVVNNKTNTLYDKHLKNASDKTTELFWHGSRNENWWSIMTAGLLIRPSNAIHTGSMFGDGIYGANKAQKSIGYTSLRSSYWAKGNSNEAILALYEFHTGKQKHIKHHDSSCYKLNHKILNSEGFDSVYAHGGADLRNDEFIVYKAEQCTIKYLVVIE